MRDAEGLYGLAGHIGEERGGVVLRIVAADGIACIARGRKALQVAAERQIPVGKGCVQVWIGKGCAGRRKLVGGDVVARAREEIKVVGEVGSEVHTL